MYINTHASPGMYNITFNINNTNVLAYNSLMDSHSHLGNTIIVR